MLEESMSQQEGDTLKLWFRYQSTTRAVGIRGVAKFNLQRFDIGSLTTFVDLGGEEFVGGSTIENEFYMNGKRRLKQLSCKY